MKFKENIVIPSLTKLDATTTIPWEIVCYFDRERKTKPITQSKRIVFEVKKVFMLYSEIYKTNINATIISTITTTTKETDQQSPKAETR